ncbi:MAG: hypothetical protein DRJ47_06545 [Thermoprotei archaeon]|nr:MAG: hypothetical protein DRJ47_06545 [Thermoprotei archaeon]
MSRAKEFLGFIEQVTTCTGQGVGNPRKRDGGASVCICPQCGYETEHERGTPCNELKCPRCGTPMVGKREQK